MAKQRTAAQDAAITKKIKILIDEGIDPDRATAAAFRMFRAGELDYMIAKPRRKKRLRRGMAAASILAYAKRKKAAKKRSKTPKRRR